MKGMISIEKDGVKICITHFPGRKKPCLAVIIDNCIYKVASFNSEETADWFIEIIEEMFEKEKKHEQIH